MSEYGCYGEFEGINAVGNPTKVFHIDEADAEANEGPVGNVRPGFAVAKGLSIETYPTLFADKAMGKGMSTTHNVSRHRSLGGRR